MKQLIKFFSFGILFILAINLSQCDWGNCKNEMQEKKDQYGEPEETSKYDSDGYHSEDWWYWSKGVQFTFTWGTDVEGCDVSKYTFDPITELNDSTRKAIKEEKTLESVEICE
jgi:hypothetical protein